METSASLTSPAQDWLDRRARLSLWRDQAAANSKEFDRRESLGLPQDPAVGVTHVNLELSAVNPACAEEPLRSQLLAHLRALPETHPDRTLLTLF